MAHCFYFQYSAGKSQSAELSMILQSRKQLSEDADESY